MIYLGLERYTTEDVKKILRLKPDGIVLGDILCDKKMFTYGGQEIPEIMAECREAGIRVIFQTPMYATDRVFGELISRIEYYLSRNFLEGVIVQDVGVCSAVRRLDDKVKIIWGKMGHARSPVTNTATVDFYVKTGVNAAECNSTHMADLIKGRGLEQFLLIGTPVYATINRECYYKYQHDIYDDKCGLGCLLKEKVVIPKAGDSPKTIDGFVLDYHNNYSEECITRAQEYDNAVIYAADLGIAGDYWSRILRTENA